MAQTNSHNDQRIIAPAAESSWPGTVRSRVQAAGLTSVLSLFLLLLAFFIMLNSLARFEAHRTRAVLGSLNATFNVSDPWGRLRAFGSFVGHVDAAAELESEITGLLRTLIGFDRFEMIREGNRLSVLIDNDVLFADDLYVAPALVELAARAVHLLENPPPDGAIEITAYARPLRGSLASAPQDELDLASLQAASIVRAFAVAGAPHEHLVAGLEDGNPKRSRIEFRVIDDGAAGARR